MLTDAVLLDISQAQRQIDQLERELDRLAQPVRVPVDIQGERAVDELRRDFQGADAGVSNLNAELAETERELRRVDRAADQSSDAVLRMGTRGTSAFTSLKTSVLGAAAAFGAIAGARAFIGFANDAVQAASDLEESISKTNVVFGDFSGEIQEFARTGPQALGLANSEALAFTSTFGNLFVALGLGQEAAAELSPQIVQLGADLASFNNIDVSEALEKLRSGLVGEAEPLRTLGVNINEALTSAKALELGLVGVNGELSEAAKVQARYALILEQTVTAEGDFARTADGIANRQRTFRAQFEDLRAEIGKALLPAFEALIDAGPSLLTLLEGLVPAIGSAAGAFSGFVTSITPLLDQVTQITQGFGAFGDILTGLSTPFRETFEIAASFFGIPFTGLEGFTGQLAETRDTIGSLFDRLQDRSAIVGLAADLEAGIGPAEAFQTRLRQVATQNDITRRTFDTLAQTAGLSGDALIDALRGIRANADAFGLDAQAVEFLNAELERLLFLQQEFERRRPGGGNRPTPVSTDIFDIVVPQALEDIAGIGTVVNDANVALANIQFEPLIEGAEQAAQAFVDLGDTTTIALEALKTEGEETFESLRGFIDDFAEEAGRRAAFQDNLALLRAMGFEDLANTFQAAGLDAAKALAQAVGDPTAAAEAERLVEENATTQARLFNDTFRAELSALILQQPVEVQLATIQIPDIQAALNIGPIGGGQGVGDIIVNFNGVENDELPSNASRAVDIINSGVNASRTGPS